MSATTNYRSTYLAAGMVGGILIGIAVGWTVRDSQNGSGSTHGPSIEYARQEVDGSASNPKLGLDSPRPISPIAESAIVDPDHSRGSALGSESQNYPSPQEYVGTQESNPRPIPVSDAHADIINSQFTSDGHDGKRKTVREVLESEPYDDDWSYFMEQSLKMFISSHANAEMFSIFHIACRTSMCEIQAVGFDDSTSPDWSRILYDLALQPWYDFGQVGTTNGNFQGQLAILTRLTRMEHASVGG